MPLNTLPPELKLALLTFAAQQPTSPFETLLNLSSVTRDFRAIFNTTKSRLLSLAIGTLLSAEYHFPVKWALALLALNCASCDPIRTKYHPVSKERAVDLIRDVMAGKVQLRSRDFAALQKLQLSVDRINTIMITGHETASENFARKQALFFWILYRQTRQRWFCHGPPRELLEVLLELLGLEEVPEDRVKSCLRFWMTYVDVRVVDFDIDQDVFTELPCVSVDNWLYRY